MKIRDLRRTAAEARRALAIGLKVQRAEVEYVALTGFDQDEAATVIDFYVDLALNNAIESVKRFGK